MGVMIADEGGVGGAKGESIGSTGGERVGRELEDDKVFGIVCI